MITSRLGLDVTVHTDHFDESAIAAKIDGTTAAGWHASSTRNSATSTASGRAELYGWSEDKARQYAKPERADFGAFIRGKKFDLS